jgi:hypothetical protein
MQQSPATWFWPIFPFYFIGLWFGISYLLSATGGWRALARCYPDEASSSEGQRFRFQSAQVGWVNYNNCVNVIVSPTGLRLSVFAPFRFGHRPIFIPWRDIRVGLRKSWFTSVGVLRFAREPTMELRLRRRLVDRIADASSGQFQVPSTAV